MSTFDVVIRRGTIINGAGSPGFVADVEIAKCKIKEIGFREGALTEATRTLELDAHRLINFPVEVRRMEFPRTRGKPPAGPSEQGVRRRRKLQLERPAPATEVISHPEPTSRN